MAAVAFARLLEAVEEVYGPPIRRPATLCKMRQALNEFNRCGLHTTRDISPALIARWVQEHAGRSEMTTYSLLRSLRAACRFAQSKGWLKRDPFEWRRPADWVPCSADPGDEEPIDRHRSSAEMRRLFDLLDSDAQSGDWKACRLRALFYTYAYLGLRKMEALNLRPADLDLPNGTIVIRTRKVRRLRPRGSRPRMVLPRDLVEVLTPWLALCGPDWVFPGVAKVGPWTGGPPGHKPLDCIKAAGKRAGIANLTILDMRHTIATLAEQWGMGELELMRWLRHDRPTTQAWYRKQADMTGMQATARKITFKLRDI